MFRESELLLQAVQCLQDLPSDEFLAEIERITGLWAMPDDVFWDVTGDVEPKTRIGLLN